MTVYELELGMVARPALALVVAHGLTDLESTESLVYYIVWTLLPLPSPAVTALFCMASVSHFSDDIGTRGSTALHALVWLVGARYGKQAAFHAMLAYLVLFHVPFHYSRCIRNCRWRALRIACIGSIVALALSPRMPSTVQLTDVVQRLAIAHIVYERTLALE